MDELEDDGGWMDAARLQFDRAEPLDIVAMHTHACALHAKAAGDEAERAMLQAHQAAFAYGLRWLLAPPPADCPLLTIAPLRHWMLTACSAEYALYHFPPGFEPQWLEPTWVRAQLHAQRAREVDDRTWAFAMAEAVVMRVLQAPLRVRAAMALHARLRLFSAAPMLDAYGVEAALAWVLHFAAPRAQAKAWRGVDVAHHAREMHFDALEWRDECDSIAHHAGDPATALVAQALQRRIELAHPQLRPVMRAIAAAHGVPGVDDDATAVAFECDPRALREARAMAGLPAADDQSAKPSDEANGSGRR